MPSPSCHRRAASLFLIPLAACLLLSSLACSRDEATPIAPARAQALDLQAAPASGGNYPLDPGWQWTYLRTLRIYDSEGNLDSEVISTASVWTMGEVDLGSLTAHGITAHIVQTGGGQTSEYDDEVYYVQDGKTLNDVAFRVGGDGGTHPKPIGDESAAPQYRIGKLTFASLVEIPRALDRLTRGTELSASQASVAPAQDGPIFIRQEPRIVFVYPLRPGQSWISFQDPSLKTGEVVRRGSLKLPSGNFGTAEVFFHWPEYEIEYTDWVAQIGLVARELRAHLQIVDTEGNILDVGELVDRSELLSFQRPRGPRPDERR